MNDPFLFSIYVQEGKAALSMNNYLLSLSIASTYTHNKNTSTTLSTEFRAYLQLKPYSRFRTGQRRTGSSSSQASRKFVQQFQFQWNPKSKKGNSCSAHYGFIMEVSVQLWSGSSLCSWSDESENKGACTSPEAWPYVSVWYLRPFM